MSCFRSTKENWCCLLHSRGNRCQSEEHPEKGRALWFLKIYFFPHWRQPSCKRIDLSPESESPPERLYTCACQSMLDYEQKPCGILCSQMGDLPTPILHTLSVCIIACLQQPDKVSSRQVWWLVLREHLVRLNPPWIFRSDLNQKKTFPFSSRKKRTLKNSSKHFGPDAYQPLGAIWKKVSENLSGIQGWNKSVEQFSCSCYICSRRLQRFFFFAVLVNPTSPFVLVFPAGHFVSKRNRVASANSLPVINEKKGPSVLFSTPQLWRWRLSHHTTPHDFSDTPGPGNVQNFVAIPVHTWIMSTTRPSPPCDGGFQLMVLLLEDTGRVPSFSSSEADVDALEQPDRGTAGYVSGEPELLQDWRFCGRCGFRSPASGPQDYFSSSCLLVSNSEEVSFPWIPLFPCPPNQP